MFHQFSITKALATGLLIVSAAGMAGCSEDQESIVFPSIPGKYVVQTDDGHTFVLVYDDGSRIELHGRDNQLEGCGEYAVKRDRAYLQLFLSPQAVCPADIGHYKLVN